MSEVIVRMEMPKCCDDCAVQYECTAREITGTQWYRKGFDPSKGRLPDCPIIGVLPEQHGDLIDRDHFKENLDMVCDAGGWLEPVTQSVTVYCKKQVDAEKAIVQATERSET